MSDQPDGYSYIALEKCGCIVAATVDRPEYARDVAKSVGGWIRGGLTVERVPHDVVRTERWGGRNCPHKAQEKRLEGMES